MSIRGDEMKPLMFALADAIETDFIQNPAQEFTGSRKAVLELFEGYSPTIHSIVESSLYDPGNKVVGADQHIFGNVGAITLVEGQQSTAHCFVYDRSKRPEDQSPFDSFWSRKDLYKWLKPSVKAIYYRSLFDTKWEQLENGRKQLHDYCKARKRGDKSREAYNTMWRITK